MVNLGNRIIMRGIYEAFKAEQTRRGFHFRHMTSTLTKHKP